MRIAAAIVLSEEERQVLAKLARSNTASVRSARRARIVLMAADGMDNTQIAAELGVGRVGVGRWRDRYLEEGRQGFM